MPRDETSPITTQSGRFRTSRYPGFTGGKVSTVTGNLAPPSSAALSGLNEKVGETTKQAGSALRDVYADNFDIPEIKTPSVGDIVNGALPGAGAYYGGKLGEKFASDVGGRLFGDGVKESLKSPLPTIGSVFGGTGDTVAGAAAREAIEAEAVTEAGRAADLATEANEVTGTFGGATGAGVGSAIGSFVADRDVGKAAKTGALSAAGYAAGNAILPGVGGPIGSFVGSTLSGRVVCTELNRHGLMSDDLLALDLKFTEHLSPAVLRGYWWWATPYVRLMRKYKLAVAIAEPLARWRAEEVAYQMRCRPRGNWKGKIVRLVGENLCRVVGWFVGPTNWRSLYVEGTHA